MSRCENCRFRDYSEKNPDKLISKIWKWHTTWCPGWRKYQQELLKRQELRKNEFSYCQSNGICSKV